MPKPPPPEPAEPAAPSSRTAFDRLLAPQRAAVRLLADTTNALVEAGKAGVTHPEEILTQVTSLARAIGDLAASTTTPLEVLLQSQRDLAEAMGRFANAQREMANVLDLVAENHRNVVAALEAVANPVIGVASVLESDKRATKTAARRAQRTAGQERRGPL